MVINYYLFICSSTPPAVINGPFWACHQNGNPTKEKKVQGIPPSLTIAQAYKLGTSKKKKSYGEKSTITIAIGIAIGTWELKVKTLDELIFP